MPYSQNPSPATRFQPGKSGFEGKQHRYNYYRALVEDLIPTATLVLEDALLNGKPKDKIAAAKVVYEFGLGKPVTARVEFDESGKQKGVSVSINGVDLFMPKTTIPGDDSKVIEG